MANLDDILRDKIITNGNFGDMSGLAQGFKFVLRRGKNWEPLAPAGKEALELIAARIAMILSGDPNSADHWNKLAMYARLMGKELETQPKSRLSEINAARERVGIKVMDPATDIDGQTDP